MSLQPLNLHLDSLSSAGWPLVLRPGLMPAAARALMWGSSCRQRATRTGRAGETVCHDGTAVQVHTQEQQKPLHGQLSCQGAGFPAALDAAATRIT